MVMAVVTLGIGIAIGVAIGGGNGDDGSDDNVAAPASTLAPDGGDEEEPSASSDEEEPASGEGGTAANPLPMSEPWTFDSSIFGEDATQWEGSFEGVVPLSVDEYDDDAGSRCYAIIGTMSPTQIADGAFTTNSFDAPSVSAIVNGTVEDEFGFCNTDAIEAAGYGWVLDAEVSVGTSYPFYEVVYLPSSVTGDIELVVLGSASSGDAVFYAPQEASIG